jgi:peroxiredoxin (alkyl hydroperoxide reductase subunit C)
LSAVAAKYDEIKSLGADVLSVSVDSHFVHKIWEEVELSKMIKGDFMPFPMGADPDGALGSLYGVYDSDIGVDIRGRFIIDPDGIIQAMEVLTPPVGRKISETIRQIKAFQLVRESKGTEACPAGWEPGKPTLKPGPNLVGKVWEVWQVDE